MVEENLKVIPTTFSALRKRTNIKINYDDFYGDCAIALCHSAQLYDKEKSNNIKFFNFACTYCYWRLYRAVGVEKKIADNEYSIDYTYAERGAEDEEEYISIIKMLKDDRDYYNDFIVYDFIEDITKKESDRNKIIIARLINGETAISVAKEYGVSRQRVTAIFKKFREQAREKWFA